VQIRTHDQTFTRYGWCSQVYTYPYETRLRTFVLGREIVLGIQNQVNLQSTQFLADMPVNSFVAKKVGLVIMLSIFQKFIVSTVV
jgi:hypothetical protein